MPTNGNRIRVGAALPLALAIALAGATAAEAPDAPLSARVVAPDGSPAAGAIVVAFDPARPGRTRARLVADGAGRVERPDGARWLAVHSPGVGFAIVDPGAAGDARALEVALAPGVALRGVVRDAATGAPAPGARVAVRYEEPIRPFRADAVADAEGRFAIDGLPPGVARVAARGPLGSRALARVFVAPTGASPVDLALEAGRAERPRAAHVPRSATAPSAAPRGGLVSGIAIGPGGAPVAGVRVALENERAGVWRETITDAAGRFAFRAAPLDGPTRVEALGPAYEGSIEEDGPLLPGAALVLPLAPLAAIRGTLAAGDATLLLEPRGGDGPVATIRLEAAAGPFLAAGLRPGTYDASLLVSGRVAWRAEGVELSPGAETDLGVVEAAGVPFDEPLRAEDVERADG